MRDSEQLQASSRPFSQVTMLIGNDSVKCVCSVLTRMVELSQTPVNQTQLALLVVDHHVVGLHIAVHDAHRVAEVQCLEQLEDVVPNVIIGQSGVQSLEVEVVHVLEDQARRLGDRISDNIQQLDDVLAPGEVLQDLDLALDFFLLHRLQNLHHTLGTIVQVGTGKYFTVLASANLAVHFVNILIPV